MDDLPWVDLEVDLEASLIEFLATRSVSEKSRPKAPSMAVLAEPAADEAEIEQLAAERLRVRDRAAFDDLLRMQELPLIDDETDAEAYEDATSGFAPPLANPHPHT